MKKKTLSLHLQRYLSKFLIKSSNLTHANNFYYFLNKNEKKRNLMFHPVHAWPLINNLFCVQKKAFLLCNSSCAHKKRQLLSFFDYFELSKESLKNQTALFILKKKTFSWPSKTRNKQINQIEFDSLRIKYFQLIRPLFSITRLDTFYICKTVKLPVYPDKSNLTITFLRNRVRKQILPSIRILLNPQFDALLCKFNYSYFH